MTKTFWEYSAGNLAPCEIVDPSRDWTRIKIDVSDPAAGAPQEAFRLDREQPRTWGVLHWDDDVMWLNVPSSSVILMQN